MKLAVTIPSEVRDSTKALVNGITMLTIALAALAGAIIMLAVSNAH